MTEISSTIVSNCGRCSLVFALIAVLIAGANIPASQGASPYPDSPIITGFSLDWSTHRRSAQGSDNFQLTWSDDDHLYGAWGDGGGFGGTNTNGRVGLGVARISGPGHNWKGTNRWGGLNPENPAQFGGKGKSWGMICVDGVLYLLVVPDIVPGKGYRNHYEYVEIWKSCDHSATWRRPLWKFLQSENLTIPTFLNFGRDNAGVPSELGDYVYVYFIHPQNATMEQQGPKGVGLVVHKPGIIYLARVPRKNITGSKSDYQFYCGLDSADNPLWGSISQKQPVFEDPDGVGWCMSAHYNSVLQRYILCTEHDSSHVGRIGIFDAPTPWGPWTTVEYCTKANPFGKTRPGSNLPWRNNVFFIAFATKWLSEDGKSFTLNFTGGGQGSDNDSFNTVSGTFMVSGARTADSIAQHPIEDAEPESGPASQSTSKSSTASLPAAVRVALI